MLDRLLYRGRVRFGSPRLLSRQDGMLAIVRTLREGRMFYFLPDMDFGPRDAIFVPFFGVPTATVTAMPRLAKLARRHGRAHGHAPAGGRLRGASCYPAVGGLSHRATSRPTCGA